MLAHHAFPSQPITCAGEEVMGRNYLAVWFLFRDAPYDIARVYRPDGAFTGYYVDVLEPVHWDDANPHTLRPLVDLFLDLWVTPEGAHEVLDEDEFEHAVAKGHLSDQQAEHARRVLRELVRATNESRFPPEMVKGFAQEKGGLLGPVL